MSMLRKKRNWTRSIAQEQRAGNIADLGAHLCHPVVGNDLRGGALHPLPGKDHHGVQFHLDLLFLPEGIHQELLLQYLGGGHRIPGDHLQYRDPHHLDKNFILGEDLHLQGDVDHHLPIAVGPQLVHLGDHHLLHAADHLLDADYQPTDTGLHHLEDAGHGLHHLEDAGHGPHLLEEIGHCLQEEGRHRRLIAHPN